MPSKGTPPSMITQLAKRDTVITLAASKLFFEDLRICVVLKTAIVGSYCRASDGG